jgi:Cytochrome c oxidase subunit III
LLTSGATVTWAHHALIARAKKHTLVALIFTLVLAILFTCLQGLEYVYAPFNISDCVYGSTFYLTTGFHGFHVFIGTLAILVSFLRIILNHFTNKHHFGFESAIWYWHFVDGASIKHVIYRYFIGVKDLLLQLKGRMWNFDDTSESTLRVVFSFRSQLFYPRRRLLQGILVRFTSIGKRANTLAKSDNRHSVES